MTKYTKQNYSEQWAGAYTLLEQSGEFPEATWNI